jgi:hypothetical protein
MAEVIDNSLSHLTKDDRRAIAIYIKSLPAVEQAARKQKKDKNKKEEYL